MMIKHVENTFTLYSEYYQRIVCRVCIQIFISKSIQIIHLHFFKLLQIPRTHSIKKTIQILHIHSLTSYTQIICLVFRENSFRNTNQNFFRIIAPHLFV